MKCECCGSNGDVKQCKIAGPPGVEFERLCCFGCRTKGTINGWIVTEKEEPK